ncbi:UDP-glucose dehydrogenase family protein [Thermostichus vulcanus]|uniref:UDP-glucose 6-dehydrogenase n=1 Tax=Thermostichus vulcanus str. 'Rupite' TaxID=2813851 RepID=A0ABT0C7Y6_THEVL|nr:UDP-glucose/GDP-mannose dehydrogenase family protein [Thermostichus vulcanus]MCJ2541895.1 UDP-glucose/GDP-mannose dehydrogenase family protein [Thermostichus vulcanus str. 'Rupite']
MRVAVIGTGYVGLVTGACLAHLGHHVICVDNNPAKIEGLQRGRLPIYEPGLEDLVREGSASGLLQFTTDLRTGIQNSQVVFIAVGTPALPSGDPDLRYVEAVAREIGQQLDEQYRVIVNKSTVPIGSGDWVRMIILDGAAETAKQRLSSPEEGKVEVLSERDPDGELGGVVTQGLRPASASSESCWMPQFDVVSNPEFLREGSAIHDTFNPDRIVVGSESPRAIQIMRELYEPILSRQKGLSGDPVPWVVTDLASAEMIKYAANAFLATKISFINEIANICERTGADVTQVADGIGLDKRIGRAFLNAGLGWGGSCFPKDVAALIQTAADYGYEARLLRATVEVNQQQRQRLVEKLQQALKVLKGKTIGLLGLTFKPNTDDMRDAPSLSLIEHLHKLGAKVKAYDPIVSGSGIREGLAHVVVETDVLRLAQDCDALVLVTEWQEFQSLDYSHLAGLMRRPLLIDARNCLDRQALRQAGMTVLGIGW